MTANDRKTNSKVVAVGVLIAVMALAFVTWHFKKPDGDHRDRARLLQRERFDSLQSQAGSAMSRVDLISAERDYTESLSIISELAAAAPSDQELQSLLGTTYSALGSVTSAQGKAESAASWYMLCVQVRRQLADLNSPSNAGQKMLLGLAYENLGKTETFLRKWDNAVSSYESALDIWEALNSTEPGKWTTAVATGSSALGEALLSRGDLDAAEKRFEGAIQQLEKLRKDDGTSDSLQGVPLFHLRLLDIAQKRGDAAAIVSRLRAAEGAFDDNEKGGVPITPDQARLRRTIQDKLGDQ